MNSETVQRIEKVAREVFGRNDLSLKPESTAQEVDGWDSLGHINFMLGLESEFGVRLRPAKTARLKDIGKLAEHIDGIAG